MVHAYIGDVPLSRKVYALLSNPDVLPLMSAISLMEIAMKHEAGKLKMGATETRHAIRDLRLQVIPLPRIMPFACMVCRHITAIPSIAC
jgi:PIN domain nuclease of toxin-antitoxin system